MNNLKGIRKDIEILRTFDQYVKENTELYKNTLRQILNSGSAELMYMFAEKVSQVHIEQLAQSISKTSKTHKNLTFRIKFAKEFGNTDLSKLCADFFVDWRQRNCLIPGESISLIDRNPILKSDFYEIISLNDAIAIMLSLELEYAKKEIQVDYFTLEYFKNPLEPINSELFLKIIAKTNPDDIISILTSYNHEISAEMMNEIIQIFLAKINKLRTDIATSLRVTFLDKVSGLSYEQKETIVSYIHPSFYSGSYRLLSQDEQKVIADYRNSKKFNEVYVQSAVVSMRQCLPPYDASDC